MSKDFIVKAIGVGLIVVGSVVLAIAGIPVAGVTGVVAAVFVVVGLIIGLFKVEFTLK